MIVKIIEIIYQLLFFITPLIMLPNTSELFEFNKLLVIYIVTVIIGALWISRMIITKKIIFKKTVLDIPIALFFISQIISTLYSIDVHTSLFGYYGRFNGGLLSILSYIILFYAFVANQISIKRVLKTIFLSSVFVLLWALPGKLGHDLTCLVFTGKFDISCWSTETNIFNPVERVFSTLGQPNWFGAYLSVNFFIGIYYWIKNKDNRLIYILNTIYLITNFSFIIFSRSRSALLSLLIGALFFSIYYFITYKKQAKTTLLSLFFLLLIPIIFFKTGISKVDEIINLPKTIITSLRSTPKTSSSSNSQTPTNFNVTESLDIRKVVWQGAINLGLKYPFFGTGVETFAYSYYFTRPKDHNLTSEWDYIYNKAHNEYLNYWATTGFFGLISYILIIIVFMILVFSLIKKLKPSSLDKQLLIFSLLSGYITILITNFFGFSTTNINLFFYLLPAFIINNLSTKLINPEKEDLNSANNLQALGLFFTVIFSLYLVISIFVYYLADVNYANGLKYANPSYNYHQQAADYFKKALDLRSEHVYFDKIAYSLAYLSALSSYQKNTDMAKSLMDLSNDFSIRALKASPKNILYYKTQAKNQFLFYQSTLDKQELLKGVSILETGKNISPYDPKIFYTLSLFYTSLYDVEFDSIIKSNYKQLSLININKAIDNKANYEDAYLFKGQLLKRYGEISQARQTFEYILKSLNPNHTEAQKELSTLP